jgi:hypothetical protein
MPHPLRLHMPNAVFECTSRTIQGRFLLRPSAQLRRRMIGILCGAHELYPLVKLHAFAVLSNHWEFLASCDCAEELALYIGYVNGNFARECGRVHNWSGPFWGRRVRMIPCLDDAATIDRLRYCMAQGVKEGLVACPLDWPGATAVPALVGDMKLQGERVDRHRLRRAREAAVRAGERASDVLESNFVSETTLQLVALPAFANLDDEALRARHVALLKDVVREADVIREGRPPLGTDTVLRQDPHAAPLRFEATDAPMCHASSASLRLGFRRLRNAFAAVYRDIADSIKLLLSPREQRRAHPVEHSERNQVSEPSLSKGSGQFETKSPPFHGVASEDGMTLQSLLRRVPPGMFLSTRSVNPSPRTLLADLVFVRPADG